MDHRNEQSLSTLQKLSDQIHGYTPGDIRLCTCPIYYAHCLSHQSTFGNVNPP